MVKKYTLWMPTTRAFLTRATDDEKRFFPNRKYIIKHVNDDMEVVTFNTPEEAISVLESEDNLGIHQFSLVSVLEVFICE